VTLLGPAAAWAQGAIVGDAAAGAEHFEQTCTACHAIKNEVGEVLVEAESRTGPNLFGVVGRSVGGDPEFYFGDMIRAYRDMGAIWEEENFVAFLPHPTNFLREVTGKGGTSQMAHGMVVDDQQAHDVWAYLATFSPTEGAEGEVGATADTEDEAAPE
jgi:cytochrome c